MTREDLTPVRVIADASRLGEGTAVRFSVTIDGVSRDAFAVRWKGEAYAYVNTCRHQSLPLDFGDSHFFDETYDALVCCHHGARYRPDSGECFEGPCRGARLTRLVIESRGAELWCAGVIRTFAGLALAALMLFGANVALAASDRWQRYAPLLATADSLQRVGASRAGFALLDSMLVLASQRESADLRVVAMLGRAVAHLNTQRIDEAEREVRSVLPDLRHSRDAVGLSRATRYLARAAELRGRATEARSGYERALGYARSARQPAEQSWALLGLASIARGSGRYAESARLSRQAVAIADLAMDGRGQLFTRIALARSVRALGEIDEARELYADALARASARRDRMSVAEVSSNVGALEHANGDPSKAASHYRTALIAYRELGMTSATLTPIYNLALVYVNLGRYDEADSVLLQVLPDAMRLNSLEPRALILSELGVVRRERGRLREAAAFGRRAIALSDSISGEGAARITAPLVATLVRLDQPDSAVALLDAQVERLRGRVASTILLDLEVSRAMLQHRLGRPRAALPALRNAALSWREPPLGIQGADRLTQLTRLASCYRQLGDADSARLWFDRAAQVWERWRSSTNNELWLQVFDDFSGRFTCEYLAALLTPRPGLDSDARVRAAFDGVQRFRARTVSERLGARPSAGTREARLATATQLQQRVLKPGELLLDLYTSPDTTIVLALTTSEARAYGVPTGTSLARRLRSLRDLLASRTETTPPRAAQLALGSEIFGPAADLITRSNRVVLSAGALALFALDQLIVPGESQPLSNAREVTWTPSASALASARSAAPGRFKRTLFAVSQSQPLEGAALPAARREVAWLSQQFAGTDVVSDAAVQSAEQVARRASGYQIVHFAAHTRSGGRRPWQDALHVAAGSRDDAWLTAAQIAQLRVPAQLCVLAGCATLGNDSQWGETLDGLATAWLIAGARTVIATRWDVDDDATSELVRRFYDRLAAGDHTAAALRRAQLEMRVQPRYERPFYWAGVFLLGEPETRVVLTRRSTGVGAPRR